MSCQIQFYTSCKYCWTFTQKIKVNFSFVTTAFHFNTTENGEIVVFHIFQKFYVSIYDGFKSRKVVIIVLSNVELKQSIIDQKVISLNVSKYICWDHIHHPHMVQAAESGDQV